MRLAIKLYVNCSAHLTINLSVIGLYHLTSLFITVYVLYFHVCIYLTGLAREVTAVMKTPTTQTITIQKTNIQSHSTSPISIPNSGIC